MGRLIASLIALAFLAGPAAGASQPAPPTLEAVRAALVGTWQSTDDTRFTRELDADGSAADRYEGDASATTTGHWALFLGSNAPKNLVGQKLEPGGFYLKLDENGDQLLFALVGLTRSDLKMIYLARGNLLSFVRLK